MSKFIDSIGARPKPKVEGAATGKPVENTLVAAKAEKRELESWSGKARKKRLRSAMGFWHSRVGVSALLLLTALLVVLIGFTYVRQMALNKSTPRVNAACTVEHRDVTGDAIAAVNTQNLPLLKAKTEEIKAFNDYATDQNCLAVVAWQQLTSSEFDNANATAEQIRSLYEPSADMGDTSALYTSDPEKLKSTIRTFQSSFERSKNSTIDFSSSATRSVQP